MSYTLSDITFLIRLLLDILVVLGIKYSMAKYYSTISLSAKTRNKVSFESKSNDRFGIFIDV